MSRQDAQIKLRLPSDLKDWIQKMAAQNKRSQGGEIHFRLEQSRKAEQMKEKVV